MSQFMKNTGGRMGVHSGCAKYKNLEVVNRLNVAGNEVPIMLTNGQVYYVDKTVTASGDGKSWKFAFKTVVEGLAALQDYDTLIIGPGNYDEDEKLEISSLKSVSIFGACNGFQWGEGSTCIRDVTTNGDILDITGCQSLEIAGICFVSSTAGDAINFTGLNHATHIHDCNFVGNVGGADMMDYGVNIAGSNGPGTYIHHCKFDRTDEAAIKLSTAQRFVCHDCVFLIGDASIGIEIESIIATSFHVIWDCMFLGTSGAGDDMGIDIQDASQQGKIGVYNCRMASCTMTGGGTTAEQASVENYVSSASGGAIINPT